MVKQTYSGYHSESLQIFQRRSFFAGKRHMVDDGTLYPRIPGRVIPYHHADWHEAAIGQ